MHKIAITLGVVVAAGMCSQQPPEVSSGADAGVEAEAVEEHEPYIERTNRNLRELKHDVQQQHEMREDQLDQRIGTP